MLRFITHKERNKFIMEYFNGILESAIEEVFERSKEEIINKISIDIKYEEIANLIHAKEIELLKKIVKIVNDEKEEDFSKVSSIKCLLSENGIHNI